MRLVLNFGPIKVRENDGRVASGESIFPHLLYITFAFSWLIFLLFPSSREWRGSGALFWICKAGLSGLFLGLSMALHSVDTGLLDHFVSL